MAEPILIDLPEEISSDRIVVRRYRPGDGVELFAAVDESREHILPWMPWGPGHAAVEDSEKMVRTWYAKWALREDLPMGIFDKASGRFIGGTGLNRIDWNLRSFEIGYWVRKSAAGQGYVTEAVRLLTGFAFDTIQANRVFIRCAVENLRSGAVARRVGFIYEGSLRNSSRDVDGRLHDMLMFSLIPEDWEALRVV
jgi:RimJ/RimL family protein N-acetyltransferase